MEIVKGQELQLLNAKQENVMMLQKPLILILAAINTKKGV